MTAPAVEAESAPRTLLAATRIVETATVGDDTTGREETLPREQWERLSSQRDVLIKAMVGVFTRLNGGVFGFTLIAWLVGVFVPDYRIVDRTTLMALIGATVVQAGIAFIAITRFLFPSTVDH